MGVRIVKAHSVRVSSVEIALLKFLDVRNGRTKDILAPSENLHSALLCGRNDQFEAINIAVVRSLLRFESGVLVVLQVWRCIIAAMSFEKS